MSETITGAAAQARAQAEDPHPARGAPKPQAVTLVINNFGEGGAQRVLSLLIQAWVDQGRRIRLITLNAAPHEPYSLPAQVARHDIDWGRPEGLGLVGRVRKRMRAYLHLRRLLAEPDGGPVISFLTQSNVVTLLALLGRSRYVVISERNDPARQPQHWLLDRLRRLLYRRAHVVSANSYGALTAMRGYVPDDRLHYLPNPLPAPPCAPEPVRTRSFLVVARLVEQKGVAVVLAAMWLLQESCAGWRLEIVGDGPLRAQLEQQARALGLVERVAFHGYCDPFPFYARCGVFLLPSYYEGTPNALLEAMQMGMPAVVSEAVVAALAPEDDAQDGSGGMLVVPAGAPGRLAAAMSRLCGDPELRGQLGEAAQKRTRLYRSEDVIRQWDAILADE